MKRSFPEMYVVGNASCFNLENKAAVLPTPF